MKIWTRADVVHMFLDCGGFDAIVEEHNREVAPRLATRLVAEAVKSGRLVKQPCEVCLTNKNVHAHHDDYKKPLKVRWLCREHHREEHNVRSA